MKPSDIEPDTIFQLQMNNINLNTTQSSINRDITDIRFASLQIQDEFSSSAEENTTTTTNNTSNKHNHNIPINPWQDMPSLSNTTYSETKSTHKNSDDNKDYHYSNILLSNHEPANRHNPPSTLWNRNSHTIVWNKQNFMNRIAASPKHHNSNPLSQATNKELWSKQIYDFHRKHHPSYNSTSQTEFLSDRINESLDNSTPSPNYNFSPIKYPRVTANGISQLLQIDSNKRINQ